ncbi:hypothetical protein [Rhodococcus qingshengii]|uniref:hypothetical protein n=1 Tax=Rhodococcus qingshengii TaxID=334542 RepID=UPI00211EAA23|nr:hypothetical protein [Rhodococcus qingshengii]
MDLRPTNADKIEAVFAPYIKVAERVSSAGKNCFDASAHGRIKADVIDAFHAAH